MTYEERGRPTNTGATTQNEVPYTATVGGVAVVFGLLIAAISPWVTRKMQGVR